MPVKNTASPKSPSSSLKLALAFLKAHPTWHIFPIQALAKEPPLINDNLNLASNDPRQIVAWSKQPRCYECNWGLSIAKSGLVVMDVDRKPGKVGAATYDALTIEYGELPETFTVFTPNDGVHYYFVGAHVQRQNTFGKDIDTPGYVLIPSCGIALDNGITGFYTKARLTGINVAVPAPDWFPLFVKPKPKDNPADAAPAVDLDQQINVDRMILYLQEGAPPSITGRNGEKALFDVAAVLKDNGISEHMAIELIGTHYNIPPTRFDLITDEPLNGCDPLWLGDDAAIEDRLSLKVHNAYEYATQTQPGAATAEAAFEGEPPEDLTPLRAHWAKLMKQQEPARRAALKKIKTKRKADEGRTGRPTATEMRLMREKGLKP